MNTKLKSSKVSRRQFVLLTFAVAMFCLIFSACGPFEGYDDDSVIVKGSGFSTKMSVETNTLSKYHLKCNECNGVKTLKTITLADNPALDISLKVESGRFKVVLVRDGKVYNICDGNPGTPEPDTVIAAGEYTLKIVAEKAKVDFTINY